MSRRYGVLTGAAAMLRGPMCVDAWEFYYQGRTWYNGLDVWQDQDGLFRYVLDDTYTRTDPRRACPSCDRRPTAEKHDACLGTLPGVRFACCGHGDLRRAYVTLDDEDGTTLYGPDALEFFARRGKEPAWLGEGADGLMVATGTERTRPWFSAGQTAREPTAAPTESGPGLRGPGLRG